MSVPAVCPSCGHMFSPFGQFGQLGGVATVSIENCQATCPRCGQMANILDGVYRSVGGFLRRVSDVGLSVERIEQLAEVFERAQRDGAPTDRVAATLQKEAPELVELSDVLPKTRIELYAFLGLLIPALTALMVWLQKSEEPKLSDASATRVRVEINNSTPLEPNESELKEMVDAAVREALAANSAAQQMNERDSVPGTISESEHVKKTNQSRPSGASNKNRKAKLKKKAQRAARKKNRK